MNVETRLCRRCWRLARADRMIQGYGSDCATQLGLTGTTTDTGHHGPNLLDLLADAVTQAGGETPPHQQTRGTLRP
ncbi:hypothetical protein GCM10010109_67690 [Actinoplanes campanulatus]|nr:hypothetical protein GCM10010109_67690 [Actinoplanes campanulatus]